MDLVLAKQEIAALKEELANAQAFVQKFVDCQLFARRFYRVRNSRSASVILFNVYKDDVDMVHNKRPWGRATLIMETAPEQAIYEVGDGDLDQITQWCKEHDLIEINL
jgi:hypothetical protein